MRESWDQRWGDEGFRPPFEIEKADPSVRKTVEDGWFSHGMRALDIGCGAGHNAAFLAEQGLDVVGVDFSRHAVERARAKFAGTPNLTFDVVDVIESGAYPQTFDALVDRGCFHGIDKVDHRKYIDNIAGWANPGSRFLLIWRNKTDSGDEVVARTRKMLEPAFTFVSADPVDISGGYTNRSLPAMAMRFVRSL